MTSLGSDGASQNRYLLQELVTVSVQEKGELRKLPTTYLNYSINLFKIAFQHPLFNNIHIFMIPDMSHMVLKLSMHWNALALKDTRQILNSKIKVVIKKSIQDL